jgi:hypothetical protein
LNDRLSSFLIEIECPSGAKLVGDLSRMAHAMALEFYITKPAEWLSRGIEIPSDIYAYIREDGGRALSFIFGMPWESLLKVLDPHTASPGPKDHELWNAMQCAQLSGKGGPNPFLVRITPKTEEKPAEIFQDIKGIAERILDHLREGNIKGAVNLLAGLVTACDNPKLPEPARGASKPLPLPWMHGILEDAVANIKAINLGPAPGADAENKRLAILRVQGVVDVLEKKLPEPAPAGDGWGHAHTADTVEALLREGSAMLEGTDKHEQMFADMDEKVKTQFLFKIIESLQKDRATQAHRSDTQSKRIEALELGMTHLQGDYMALLTSTQKIHRRLKLGQLATAYGGATDPDQPKGLQRTHDTLKGIIQLAAKIQNDPVLRQFLA